MSLSNTRYTLRAPLWFVWALSMSAACTSDDLGMLCTSPNIVAAAAPIAGESVLTEAINLTRDQNCTQFACLSAQGLPSYCTKNCAYGPPPKKPSACAIDTDCKLPLHCHDNICTDDDCPAGFFCQTPMATGSLAGQLMCVRQTGCLTDPDCGNVAELACVKVGCYDSCLAQDANTPCAVHLKTCAPLARLACVCTNAADSCADSERSCTPPNAAGKQATTLPKGAVASTGVCLPK